MFGHGGGNDDRQDGPAQPVPSIPALRTFKVALYNLAFQELYGGFVKAHEAACTQAGNAVVFREYYMDPNEGPTHRTVKCILKPADCWLTYEEVETVNLSVTH